MVADKPSRILLVILVVVVIAAASGAAAYVYEVNKPKSPTPILTIQVGDNATVNYIGMFFGGAQSGRVFDTSFYSVATSNISYPKSLEYQSRGPPSAYTVLPVFVGGNAPSAGYTVGNLTFHPVVTGFWQGMVGMAGNETRTISFPAALGYGALNASCLGTAPLVYSVPVLTIVPASKFATVYPNVTATVGTQFSDPSYGWNDTVFAVNSTSVTVQALATSGWVAHPNGLPFVVSNLNSSRITLSSQLTSASAGKVLGHAATGGLCGGSKFIVSAVDPAMGSYTENFNPEVVGQSLEFIVTVVDIFPG